MKTNRKLIVEIIISIIIFIAIASYVLPRNLGDLDEIWIYNSAKNISDGLLPYKDFNLVTTPFLPLLAGGILKIFPNELIVMRVLAIILSTAIIFMIIKIMNKLKINKYLICISIITIIFMLKEHFCIDYNFINLLLLLFIIYLELINIEKNNYDVKSSFKYDLLIGVLAGVTVGFKQTTGIVICIIVMFNNLLIIKEKEEWKEFFKILFIRLLGTLIPVGCLVAYISFYKLWPNFIDYCILGIKEFTNVIPYTNLFNSEKVLIKIVSIVFPITLIYMYLNTVVMNKKTKEKREIFYLFAYSVASSIVIFPISDEIHFLIGIIPVIIAITYIINSFIKWISNKIDIPKLKIFIKEFIKCGIIIFIIINLLINIINLLDYFNKVKNQKNIIHYSYIPISEGIYERIVNIKNYIKNQNRVYILDASAAIFKIPLNMYDKNYDLFLKGNLGENGTEKMIQEISKLQDAKILIQKKSRNWQTPENVIEFVQNNLTKTGEIDLFEIYEN